jgi:hypothetical protein
VLGVHGDDFRNLPPDWPAQDAQRGIDMLGSFCLACGYRPPAPAALVHPAQRDRSPSFLARRVVEVRAWGKAPDKKKNPAGASTGAHNKAPGRSLAYSLMRQFCSYYYLDTSAACRSSYDLPENWFTRNLDTVGEPNHHHIHLPKKP